MDRDLGCATPAITGFDPRLSERNTVASFQVQGINFEPGIRVIVGSETPTPKNVTPASFDVALLLPDSNTVEVTVTHICGK